MAKKRISNKEMRNIARARMEKLLDLASAEAREGNEERSRRYVSIARSIAMRTNTPMMKERHYCRDCSIALIPGRNCTVRLRSNRVTVHCLACGSVRRVPYLKEKRGEFDGRKAEQERSGQERERDKAHHPRREGGFDRGYRGGSKGPDQEE